MVGSNIPKQARPDAFFPCFEKGGEGEALYIAFIDPNYSISPQSNKHLNKVS